MRRIGKYSFMSKLELAAWVGSMTYTERLAFIAEIDAMYGDVSSLSEDELAAAVGTIDWAKISLIETPMPFDT